VTQFLTNTRFSKNRRVPRPSVLPQGFLLPQPLPDDLELMQFKKMHLIVKIACEYGFS